MTKMNLGELSKRMRDIDFVMLQTRTAGGQIAGRPMSNNQDVEYDGDSWFFLDRTSGTFEDVQNDPQVNVALQGRKGLLGAPPLFVSIEGRAEIVEDRKLYAQHWRTELDRWWDKGVETPSLALLKVHAERIHYWDGDDEGEIVV